MKFKNLNVVSKIIAGQSPPSTTYNKSGEGLPFFQGKADFQDKYPKVRSWCTSKKKKEALPGDILLSVRAPVGPVNICNQSAVIGRGLSAIRPLEGTHGDYLYYFLKSNEQNIAGLGTGSTFKAITQETLGNLQIPIPLLHDQMRIATLLSRVEALIATRKDNLRLLDEFLKSTFLEMFGVQSGEYKKWKSEKLIRHTDIVSGVTKGKKYRSEALIEIAYMRVANVQDGYFNLEEIKTISVTQAEINKYRLVRGDVLLTEGGDPDKLGRGSVWEEQLEKCIHQNHIFRVRALDWSRINPYYLSALIGSIYGKSYFLKAAKQTTGIASINSTQLKNFPLIIAPIDLQNNFAAIADKVESLKNLYQQSLTDLENLYGALSQKAFKGELNLSRIPLEQKSEPQMDANGREYADEGSEPISTAMPEPVGREQLLRRFFDAFVAERKGESFSLDDLWTLAEQKVLDHMGEESPPLGVPDYDKIREWLFDLLKNGQVSQLFFKENNYMGLSIKG